MQTVTFILIAPINTTENCWSNIQYDNLYTTLKYISWFRFLLQGEILSYYSTINI